jgi:hypothetical protein
MVLLLQTIGSSFGGQTAQKRFEDSYQLGSDDYCTDSLGARGLVAPVNDAISHVEQGCLCRSWDLYVQGGKDREFGRDGCPVGDEELSCFLVQAAFDLGVQVRRRGDLDRGCSVEDAVPELSPLDRCSSVT